MAFSFLTHTGGGGRDGGVWEQDMWSKDELTGGVGGGKKGGDLVRVRGGRGEEGEGRGEGGGREEGGGGEGGGE